MKWLSLIVAWCMMVAFNIAANVWPLNNQTTGEVSDRVEVLFTPAGYVFSIWSLIYIVTGVWVLLQRRKNVQRAHRLFIVSCCLNIGWLFTWHYEVFWLSQLIMFCLLFTLIALYESFETAGIDERLPFSIYLAWISVATIANMSFTLKYYGVSLSISEPLGTVGLLFVAAILALLSQYLRNDILFVAVFVWSFIGIAVANAATVVGTAAWMVAIAVAIGALAISFLPSKKPYA